MRALGCVALLVAFVVGVAFGLYGTRGEDPGFTFAVAMGAGLFCVLAVLMYGGVTHSSDGSVGVEARLGIWAPVVAGIGFFVTWTEGLLTQVIVGAVGALVGLILPSALRHRRRSRGAWRGHDDFGDGGGEGVD